LRFSHCRWRLAEAEVLLPAGDKAAEEVAGGKAAEEVAAMAMR